MTLFCPYFCGSFVAASPTSPEPQHGAAGDVLIGVHEFLYWCKKTKKDLRDLNNEPVPPVPPVPTMPKGRGRLY